MKSIHAASICQRNRFHKVAWKICQAFVFIVLLHQPAFSQTQGYWDTRFGTNGLGLSSGSIQAAVTDGTNIYFGGVFGTLGGLGGIVKWDGSHYQSIGVASAEVWSLSYSNRNLYVGGAFDSIGGVKANQVARWDGTNWFPVGTGPSTHGDFAVYASETNFYAQGDFTNTTGQVIARGIGRWNGTSWESVGTTQALAGASIKAFGEYNGRLFVGGSFPTNALFHGLAQWDGTNWFDVGGGITGNGPNTAHSIVWAFCRYGTNLIVGGSFTNAGGMAATNLAIWNGTSWSAMPGAPNGDIYILAEHNGILYAGGTFTTMGGISAGSVAQWDGKAWSALGDGTANGGFTDAIASLGNDIYVAGGFSSIGGVVASGLSIWHLSKIVSDFNSRITINRMTNNRLQLTWGAAGPSLESSTNLSADAVWTPVLESVAQVSLTITNDLSNRVRFYRLRQ